MISWVDIKQNKTVMAGLGGMASYGLSSIVEVVGHGTPWSDIYSEITIYGVNDLPKTDTFLRDGLQSSWNQIKVLNRLDILDAIVWNDSLMLVGALSLSALTTPVGVAMAGPIGGMIVSGLTESFWQFVEDIFRDKIKPRTNQDKTKTQPNQGKTRTRPKSASGHQTLVSTDSASVSVGAGASVKL